MDERLRQQFTGFIQTPQIWENNDSFPYPLFFLKETALTKQPKDLNIPPTMVLGKRVEKFFQFYIEHYAEEQVMAKNEQIIADKITLGELDFLLRNPTSGEITHVELVYKFYLFDPRPAPEEFQQWTGPNHRDNLLKKLNRLKTRQFPLLYNPATQNLLQELNVSAKEINQKLCFKANLFLPMELQKRHFNRINPEAIQGFWIKAMHFTAKRFGKGQFFSPKKPDWPIHPKHNEQWIGFEEILEQVNSMLKKEQSPLMWMKDGDGNLFRFFIVWWK